jgi:hypothetical protein
MAETKVFPPRISEALIKSVFTLGRLRNDVAVPTSQITIFSGFRVGDVDGGDIIETTSTLTLNMAVVGANGRDAGSIASSTWYYIYLIKQAGGTVASLASTSYTSPTMPSGYVYKRIVGAIKTSGTTLIRIEQAGNQVVYTTAVNEFTGSFPGSLNDYHLDGEVPKCSLHVLLGFYIYCYDGDNGSYYYAPAQLYNGSSNHFLGAACQAHDDNDNSKVFNSVWLPIDENRYVCIGSSGDRSDSGVRVQGYTIDP